jgi:hypothetical protein
MNRNRRKRIEEVAEKLETIKFEVNELADEEDQYRDEIPENLQSGERFEESEAWSDLLWNAESIIDYLIDDLNTGP